MEDGFTVAADYISTKVNEAAERCERNVNFDPEKASVLVIIIIKIEGLFSSLAFLNYVNKLLAN